MTTVYVKDRSGKTLKSKEIGGQLYPDFSIESLNNVFDFKPRPDDILLCTPPKCGTHWTYEMIRFLLAGTTDLPLVEKQSGFMEYLSPSEVEALPSPRLLNTHYHFDSVMKHFLDLKCKTVYVTRDPRDAVVSYYQHIKYLIQLYGYEGDWYDFFQLYMDGKVQYGLWFDYTKDWEQGMSDNPGHPFLPMNFEVMKKQPFEEIKRLDQFLGTGRTDAFIAEVADKTQFKNMKEDRMTRGTPFPGLYRKGEIGDWKNWFTVAQQELFDQVFEKEMVGTDAYKHYSRSIQRQDGKVDETIDKAATST